MEELIAKITERVYAYGSGPVESGLSDEVMYEMKHTAHGITDFTALKNDLRELGCKKFKMNRKEGTLSFSSDLGWKFKER